VSTTPEASQADNSRWREYYAVRLGVGIGTPLTCMLWLQYSAALPFAGHVHSPFHSTKAHHTGDQYKRFFVELPHLGARGAHLAWQGPLSPVDPSKL
jgi:hypothetical protein